MTTRFVPTCKGCGKGACFGIGAERREFAKLQWWCGACIPPELATWRNGAPFETPPAVAPQGDPSRRAGGAPQDEGYRRIPGGLF